ncbi:DUF6119 family protein [Candidatus Jettenia sp. AMX1]|uniref:DUF6119 family protein n=1 Tax=Candidatus Jettenia sp. AMX1 TaxID=2293637 RepID=UPI000323394A|nr:DUF6119 family protein [Candidatus Jettenia sp. AMX1]GIL19446.1 MAG: hypothetical protein BroJett041_05600 [Candidatus Jettenia caeni]GJQ46388.1 MAG: hypothetical protein JETCAE04_21420 [Candidatus Jettenia caeni]
MAKYNIYRIEKSKESSLIEKLQTIGLSLARKKSINGFTLSFYFSKEPEDIDIWWVDLYKDYFSSDNKPKNKAYFGVFLISNSTLSYAISMGKSHFYLKDFCDTDFGINLAERIADDNNLKLKNSKLFGGKRSKTIISYQENSEIEYDSGESIHYVKAKTINKDKWGEIASFGNSTQLHLKILPDNLPELVQAIEEELRKNPRIILPRATSVVDSTKIVELDQKLAQEILNSTNAGLQPAEATVSGVDFIFLGKNQYSFILGRQRQDIEELSLSALHNFINRYNINLVANINNIRVKVSDENNKGYAKPLKFFFDFVDDEKHFLLDGKWHVFNQNYIEFLMKQIDEKITFENPNTNFSNSAFEKWQNSLSGQESGVYCYPEYYFNSLRENEGYVNLDRHLTTIRQYKIEKLDLFKDSTAFFVKIGTTQKFAYAIDQAVATVKILQNLNTSIQINNQDVKPKKICLWFIFERQTPITKIAEIKSFIFLMKLAEWQRQCSNSGFEPVVRIGYRTN